MSDDFDLTRREALGVVGLGGLVAMTGPVAAQQVVDSTENEFNGVALLVGPERLVSEEGEALHSSAATFFDDKPIYHYLFQATDTGTMWYIEDGYNNWIQLTMQNPTTQVDEVRVKEYNTFFDHTFARPNAPDSKNWIFTDADVTKQNSEVQLASTTELKSTQHGNYPPGTEAIPGVAWRTTAAPSSGRGEAGYFDVNNGFGVGEDATDSYVFIRKGGTTHRVHRTDWNQHVPNSRVWASDSPVITRFPHLFYGGGSIEVRALLHENNESDLTILHRFTPENVPSSWSGPPFDQPNLPITFKSSSLTGAAVRANAAHYEFGEPGSETRVNGEHFTGVTVATTGWTPLIAWRKRDGWEMVNVKPLGINVSAEAADLKLELQLDATLDTPSFALPTNTSGAETAVELETAPTLSANGERRWTGYVTGGQGSKSSPVVGERLDFNLPTNQTVVLTAQAVGAEATASGAVNWGEFF